MPLTMCVVNAGGLDLRTCRINFTKKAKKRIGINESLPAHCAVHSEDEDGIEWYM